MTKTRDPSLLSRVTFWPHIGSCYRALSCVVPDLPWKIPIQNGNPSKYLNTQACLDVGESWDDSASQRSQPTKHQFSLYPWSVFVLNYLHLPLDLGVPPGHLLRGVHVCPQALEKDWK